MASLRVLAAAVFVLFASANLSLSSGAVVAGVQDKSFSDPSATETIESLAASRILMDQTSSPPQLLLPSSASRPVYKSVLREVTTEVRDYHISSSIGSSKETEGDKLTEDVIHSPLHVAQCRATCLEKYMPTTTPFQTPMENRDELIIVPKLYRKRRSTGSNKFSPFSSTTCFQDAFGCLPCWESCQLLEAKSTRAAGTPCSASDAQQSCEGGCQVACTFFEKLLAKDHDLKNANIVVSTNPVVATKQESVLRMNKGKLTWPALSADVNERGNVSPVVYAVIQENSDRNWRQIAQTAELELQLPSHLTKEIKAKFSSVRVLAVGTDGLHTVYSPRENSIELPQPSSMNPRKDIDDDDDPSQNSNTSKHVSNAQKIEKSEDDFSSGSVVSESSASDGSTVETSQEKSGAPVMMPSTSASSSSKLDTVTTTTAASAADTPYVLRLVSLIHQKSLVIAELRWAENGNTNNNNVPTTQDYLITWELAGGGLKGHLVTDSTSVTLSLWPDATYQIQVAQFTPNLDSDGEQQNQPTHPTTSLTSLPLFVDTSVASFPLERPSALLGSKMTYEDNNDQLEIYEDHMSEDHLQNDNGDRQQQQQQPYHKFSVKVFCIAFVSLVLVLLILTIAAYLYLKFVVLFVPQKSCEKLYQNEDDDDDDNDDNQDEEYECVNSTTDCEYYGGVSEYKALSLLKEKDSKKELQVPQERQQQQHHDYCLNRGTEPRYYSPACLYHFNGNCKCKANIKKKCACEVEELYHLGPEEYTHYPGLRSSAYSEAPPVPPLAVISYSSALSSLAAAAPGEGINRELSGFQAVSLYDSYRKQGTRNNRPLSRFPPHWE